MTTPAQVTRDHLKSEDFTWIVVEDKKQAQKLASRMITRGWWFVSQPCSIGGHYFIFSSVVDLGHSVFKNIVYRID